jgi:hypothetical protein
MATPTGVNLGSLLFYSSTLNFRATQIVCYTIVINNESILNL